MNEYFKTVWLTYFTALFAGIAFPLSGILSPQIAVHFNVPATRIVFIDALVLFGLITGNVLSGKVIKTVRGWKTLVFSVCILIFDQFGIAIQNSLIIYAVLTYLFGLSMGLLIPAVNFIIVNKFSLVGQSTSKLNIMNFFVGIGAFIGSGLCGLIAGYSSWRFVFVFTGIIFIVILIAAYFLKINEDVEKVDIGNMCNDIKVRSSTITLGVFLVGIALIAYVYTEYVITYWFSPYLQKSAGYNVQTVGLILSCFWLSLAVGRYVFGVFVISKIQDYFFIIIAACVTLIGFLVFISTQHFVLIILTVILLGFSCSGIYPTLIGYGMKQSKVISPMTMSFLVTSGSLGGGISLLTSAALGSYLPKIAAVYMGPVCCVVIVILIMLSRTVYKNKEVFE